jgi:hypothetical protein
MRSIRLSLTTSFASAIASAGAIVLPPFRRFNLYKWPSISACGDEPPSNGILLGKYWEYVGWGNVFPREAWLIDVSDVRKARVHGIGYSYSKVPTLKLKDRRKADLSFRTRYILIQ